MSNRAYVDVEGSTVLIYDDYDKTFMRFEVPIPDDDLDLLKIIHNDRDDSAQQLFEFLVESEKGVTIRDTYYNYDKIKNIIG